MDTSAPSGFVIDPRYTEKQRLFRAIDRAAIEAKARVARKLDQGWVGWEDEDILPLEELHRRLLACAAKTPLALDQEADVIAYAAFLHHRRRAVQFTAPADPGVDPRPRL